MKFSRRDLLAGASCAALFNGEARARFPHGSGPTGLTSFSPILIGGGGFVTGIDISPDSLSIVSRVDVFGVYKWNSVTGQHDLLQTTTRFPAGTGGGGGIEIVSAPSNSSIIYAWLNDGNLYLSQDGGATFTQLTGFGTHDTNTANDKTGIRLLGPRIAVDPINPAVVYVGTRDAGVKFSTNATGGSATFSSATGITAAGSLGYFLAFDKNGGNNGTSTNILYVMSDGNGPFKMTTPGGSFSAVGGTGGPTTCARMSVSPNSNLYVSDNVKLYKCTTPTTTPTWTSWGSGTTGIATPRCFAIDTTRSGNGANERVILCDDNGHLSVTSNSGTSWPTGNLSFTLSSPDIPYLATAGAGAISCSNIAYDAVNDLLWLSEGFGICTAPGSTAANFTWTFKSKGLESMEPQKILASPNITSTPTLMTWDLVGFYISNPDTYSATKLVNTTVQSIIGGWDADWASFAPSTQVYLASWGGVSPGSVGDQSVSVPFDASNISSDAGVTSAPIPMSAQSVTASLTASGATAAGNTTFNVSSTAAFPWIGRGCAIKNNTHPTSIIGYVTTCTATTITIDRPIAAPGISNLDSITVGFPGSGQVRVFATSAGTASGNQLHFTGLPTDAVHPNMNVFNLSNIATTSTNGGTLKVSDISGGTVTLSGAVLGAIASGDAIMFTNNGLVEGGAICALSATNFIAVGQDRDSFPSYTTDGGATWTPINISGVPRALSGSCALTTTVTVSDTSNLVIGATFTDMFQASFQGVAVASITDSTHFEAGSTSGLAQSGIAFGFSSWGSAYTSNQRRCAADRGVADKAYLYSTAPGFVYVTTDKGATWSIANANAASFNGTVAGNTLTVNSGTPPAVGQRIMELTGKPNVIAGTGSGPFTLDGGSLAVGPIAMTSKVDLAKTYGINGGQNMMLKSVPNLAGGTNTAGHLFMTNANFTSNTIIRSTDAGATWSVVGGGITAFTCFGFGKSKAGGYPTVFVYGYISGVLSIYRSDDNCVTWIDLFQGIPNKDKAPLSSLDNIVDLDGDKNIYGKLYGAFGSSGGFYGVIH